MSRRLLLAGACLLWACQSPPTSVLLHVVGGPAALSDPAQLRVTAFGPTRLAAGDGSRGILPLHQPLPVAVELVAFDPPPCDFRVLVEALDGSGAVVGQAAGYAPLATHRQVLETVTLSDGKLPDADADGIPNVIDECTGADGNDSCATRCPPPVAFDFAGPAVVDDLAQPTLPSDGAVQVDDLSTQDLSGDDLRRLPDLAPLIENVVWTDLQNAVATGNTVTRSGGVKNVDDSGALARQTILSGDGYFQFTASSATPFRLIGFTHTPNNSAIDDLEFAFYIQANYADCFQANGSHKLTYVNDIDIVDGDVLRLAIVGGVITFYKNGVKQTGCVTTFPITYPLTVETRLISDGSNIAGATIHADALGSP